MIPSSFSRVPRSAVAAPVVKHWRYVVASMAVLAGLPSCAASFKPDKSIGFIRQDASIPPYFVYVPKDWTAERSWPVIVYLHGMGEAGSDGVKPTQVGLGPTVARSRGSFPAVVIFPQAPAGTFWGAPANNARVLGALDEVMLRYHGDPARVYLTGSSLGGFGTWLLGSLHPERFAALVPICGGVRGRAPSPDAPLADVREEERAGVVARRIGRLPVWIFHGAEDSHVPVEYSRELHRVIKEAGGDVRYTEYPGVGHESWDRAYAEPEFLPWLLAQHR